VTGCVDSLETGSVESHGFLNGFLNGFYHPEGLTNLLSTTCPILGERLTQTGGLDQPFPAAFAAEAADPECDKVLFYTTELMLPSGSSLTIHIGTTEGTTYQGAMGMQYLVGQVYPGYSFVQSAFRPEYPVARKIVTQGYAALTNQYTRTVSFRTNVAAMDAHRAPGEDNWPREFTQIVPFTAQGLAAMLTDSAWLNSQPDFFNPCDPLDTNYDYIRDDGTPSTGCPVPMVVHGDVDYVNDVIPGRSCRIIQPGETVPEGSTLNGDVIVPEGGCPLIYYAGRKAGEIVYDDRTHNAVDTTDGCDVTGPSALTNCTFDLVGPSGSAVPANRLDYWVFNVQPVAP